MNWNCDETRRHWLRQDELSEVALEHLAQCALCQELITLPAAVERSTDADAGVDVARLLGQTQQVISREQGLFAWLRSRNTSLRLVLGLAFISIPAAAQLVLARRMDLGDYPLPRLLLTVGSYSIIAFIATKVLLAPLYRRVSARQLWISAALCFALPLAVAALAPAYSQQLGSHPDVRQRSFLLQAWICLRYGTLLSMPAVLLLLAMDRQLAKGRRFLTLASGIGGIVGNFALLLHCPIEQPAHQLLGHAAVGAVLLVSISALLFTSRKA